MSEKFGKTLTPEYWDKLLGDNFSLRGVGWPNWPESYNSIVYKKYLKGFIKVINYLKLNQGLEINKDVSVFEVGAGTGFYTNYFQQLGVKDYVGIDISEISISNLKLKFPDYSFERIDISQNTDLVKSHVESFDIICVVDVLLHVTDDARFRNAVNNICCMLKKGGYLIIGDQITIYRTKNHSDNSKYKTDVSRNIRYIEEVFSKFNINVVKIFHRQTFFLNKNIDFKHPFFEKIHNIFFYFLNGSLSVFRKSNVYGHLVGKPLSFLDLIIVPFQKYSKNNKFVLLRKLS